MVKDRVDHFLVAVNHLQQTVWRTCFQKQLSEADGD